MEILKGLLDFVLHLDKHLSPIIQQYGAWTYLLLFAIVFCETGLVVTPFLPGDSLLFAAGAFAANGSLSIWALIAALVVAAVLGDTANYWIGHFLGARLLNAQRRLIKPAHIAKTHEFFEKYGGKTIIIARFVPIVRTFAPFVAGLGSMSYGRFMSYNVIGGIGVGAALHAGRLPVRQSAVRAEELLAGGADDHRPLAAAGGLGDPGRRAPRARARPRDAGGLANRPEM